MDPPPVQGRLDKFFHSELDTATGRKWGWDAYVQILIIPICLALAATTTGAVWVSEG